MVVVGGVCCSGVYVELEVEDDATMAKGGKLVVFGRGGSGAWVEVATVFGSGGRFV